LKPSGGGFSFISYYNARKKGQFLPFLLKITEKRGKTFEAERRRDRRAILERDNNGDRLKSAFDLKAGRALEKSTVVSRDRHTEFVHLFNESGAC